MKTNQKHLHYCVCFSACHSSDKSYLVKYFTPMSPHPSSVSFCYLHHFLSLLIRRKARLLLMNLSSSCLLALLSRTVFLSILDAELEQEEKCRVLFMHVILVLDIDGNQLWAKYCPTLSLELPTHSCCLWCVMFIVESHCLTEWLDERQKICP